MISIILLVFGLGSIISVLYLNCFISAPIYIEFNIGLDAVLDDIETIKLLTAKLGNLYPSESFIRAPYCNFKSTV